MAPTAISPPLTPPATHLHHALPAEGDDSLSTYRGYHHVHWWVGNAKQAAAFYVSRMGFSRVAYRGLETGSRAVASHVVRNGNVTFVLSTPLRGPPSPPPPPRSARAAMGADERCSAADEAWLLADMHDHINRHGDGVKDVAFEVDDLDAVFERAVRAGAAVTAAPHVAADENGKVRMATICTYGDTTHTLIERKSYAGVFLPGFRPVPVVSASKTVNQFQLRHQQSLLPPVQLELIDHCVGNQDWYEMDNVCE